MKLRKTSSHFFFKKKKKWRMRILSARIFLSLLAGKSNNF